MAIPLILGLFLIGYKPGIVFFLVYLSFLLLTALVLTLSRGGWIGSLLGLSFMSMALLTSRHFKRKGFLMSMIGGSVALALIFLASTPVVERVRTVVEKEEEASFSSRVVAWGGVVEMIGDYPLLGTGPGTFATVFTKYQPAGLSRHYTMAHNDYLHFTSEVGLPLIAVFSWMVIAFYKRGFYKLKNPSRLGRGITLGAMSGITAILFHSISDFNLHIPANALLFTVLVAIVVSPLPKSYEP
jgi:O-antigen ligase